MKHTLNLSEGFWPLATHTPLKFKSFTFKGGEPHLQILEKKFDPSDEVVVVSQMRSSEDLIKVILAKDALERLEAKKIELYVPYFPAARQDRICNEGEPFTLKVFAGLINNCKFDKVSIFSPHSEVTPALIDNVHVVELDESFVAKVLETIDHDGFVYIASPDAGADKRVGKIVSNLLKHYEIKPQLAIVRCGKVRDVVDGTLKEFFVQAEDLEKKPVLMLDDVIAMGGTFLGLADELRKKNAGSVFLYTSHADCQEGLDNVAKSLDGVFTTNSHGNFQANDKLTILEL